MGLENRQESFASFANASWPNHAQPMVKSPYPAPLSTPLEDNVPRESRYLSLPDDYFSRPAEGIVSTDQLTLGGVDPVQRPFRRVFADACRRCGSIHVSAGEARACLDANGNREQP